MRRRITYAPYLGTVVGVLIGLLVVAKAENLVLAILAAVGSGALVGVIWWNIEKLIYKGTDAAFDAAHNAINRRKEARDPHTPQKLADLYAGQEIGPAGGTASRTGEKTVSSPARSVPEPTGHSDTARREDRHDAGNAAPPYRAAVPTSRSVSAEGERDALRLDRPAAPKADNGTGSDRTEEPLAGFLKFLVVIYYIAAVAMIVSGVITIVQLFSLMVMMNRYGISVGWLWFAILLLIVAYPVTVWACFQLARRIQQRDPSFLWFYHRMGLIAIPLELIVFIVMASTAYMREASGQIIVSIIEGLIGAIALTVYFVRSKRVHAYMGTDDYLYQSPFTRKYARSTPKRSTVAVPFEYQSGYRNVPANPRPAEKSYASKKVAVDGAEEKEVSVSPVYCCLCENETSARYAVLLIAKDGKPMRACRKCYTALRDLGTSEDVDAVRRAGFYVFQRKLNIRDPELSAYLERYLASADAYIGGQAS